MEIVQMATGNSSLNMPQLELLQMFARPVDANDWQNIKRMITQYFAEKAIQEANSVWDNEGWNEKKVNDLLNTHLRTPRKP